MIVNDLNQIENKKFTVIIIGSGFAGISAALKLEKKGFETLIIESGNLDFGINSIKLSFLLIIAGPMTVIPLFFFVKGVHLAGLGPSGMLFFITPTFQFILGLFLYNEPFDTYRLIGFILIWVAVIIYIFDLYGKN